VFDFNFIESRLSNVCRTYGWRSSLYTG